MNSKARKRFIFYVQLTRENDKQYKYSISTEISSLEVCELPTLILVIIANSGPHLKNKLRLFESHIKYSNNTGTLCVHIHVYYAEELEVILRIIAESIDIIDAIIITLPVNRGEIKSNINHLGIKYLPGKEIKIIMTENKGRNIKPMIIDAWNYISGFSYCLHLHTKRTKGPGDNYKAA